MTKLQATRQARQETRIETWHCVVYHDGSCDYFPSIGLARDDRRDAIAERVAFLLGESE